MPILQSNQNTIFLKASASLLVEYVYYAVNTILFVRGFSTMNNFNMQYYYGTPIWILTDEKLSNCFKPQLKSLRELLIHHFVRKIFLYLRISTTNEIVECWEFIVECDEHNSCNSCILKRFDLLTVQKEIGEIMQQICSIASYLPVLTREWKYTITIKLEEPLMSNIATLNIPRIWFKNKELREFQNMSR